MEKVSCKRPLRISASMINTRFLILASNAARLVLTKDLPIPGAGLLTMMTLVASLAIVASSVVRKPRSDSTEISSGS